jgi:hypothetical protein
MIRKLISAAATVAVLCVVTPSVGVADPVIEDYPAGLACPDFDLRIEIAGAPRGTSKEFYDNNGNLVRFHAAGRGNSLTFINLNTGASLPLKMNGYSVTVVYNSDGSLRAKSLGHVVLIMFPTDIPAGPSTTLYVGQLVYSVDPAGVWTLESSRGNSTDICTELSG